jgi:LysR family transcriptional regulator, nitrogen assimilation regulatory protein
MSNGPLPYDARRLGYFVAVCEHGGISKAASAIGVAQPALTRQIQLLEQELDILLFRRSGRCAEPTDAARHLLERIKPHMAGIEQALAEIREDAIQQALFGREAL